MKTIRILAMSLLKQSCAKPLLLLLVLFAGSQLRYSPSSQLHPLAFTPLLPYSDFSLPWPFYRVITDLLACQANWAELQPCFRSKALLSFTHSGGPSWYVLPFWRQLSGQSVHPDKSLLLSGAWFLPIAEQGWFLLTGCYLQSFSISSTQSQTSSTHCLWNKCKQNLPISQFKEELTIQFRLAPYQSKPNLCYPCASWNNSAHRTGHINVSANLVTLSVWPMPRDRVRELQQVDLEVTGKYHQSAPLLQDRSNDF